MTSDELMKLWGFDLNPFRIHVAEDDLDMRDIFYEPPSFNFTDILGDLNLPSSAIAFGYRGEGKSALFRMVLSSLKNGPYFVIEHKDFSQWKEKDIETITLDHHLDHIISLGLEQLIKKAESRLDILERLRESDLARLQWYILSFRPSLEDRLLALFDKLPERRRLKKFGKKGLRKVSSYLRRKRVMIEKMPEGDSKAAQFMKAFLILIAPTIAEGRGLAGSSKIELLKMFRGIVIQAGFKSIFILVDKVDEGDVVSSSPHLVVTLIRPIVTSTQYLELRNIATKLFLPTQVSDILGNKIRRDRLRVRNIKWTSKSLLLLLEKRLLVCSGQKHNSLKPFVEDSAWEEFENKLLQYSAQNPRNLIRLLDYIISRLSEGEKDLNLINAAAIDDGVAQFYNDRAAESDGEEYLKRVNEFIRRQEQDKEKSENAK